MARLVLPAGSVQTALSGLPPASNSSSAIGIAAISGGNSWLVEVDVNGDTVADFALLLTVADSPAIAAADFIL